MTTEEIQAEGKESASEELEKYLPRVTFEGELEPSFRNIPLKAQGVLLLRSMGFTNKEIANQVGLASESVAMYLAKYDPDHKFRLSNAQVKEVRRAYWNRVHNLSVASLSQEDIEMMDAEKRVKMASKAHEVLEKIEAPVVERKSARDLLKRLCVAAAVTEEEKRVKDEAVGISGS